ncbi:MULTISPECIES: hypothetical protein [Calothrix]|uniref:Uncharacterized protein n=2 Tax=Calothrix TaxID=1186 RepID=A0ABR8ADZ4_9CYAN|nr:MULTISPECIES: hypothetical protein [Calothrix]MBD2197979.1 hypothetical protein [Calothrix parietina FACHB-288]MBD2226736.1 hypothetical protein [Calothrix anomala FACHB-343]
MPQAAGRAPFAPTERSFPPLSMKAARLLALSLPTFLQRLGGKIDFQKIG